MNEIKVTTELCQEDRNRLDAIVACLLLLTKQEDAPKAENPAPVAAKPKPLPVAPAKEEEPAQPEDAPEEVEDVKLEEIQQKVVKLCAAGKKAEARAVIQEYGAKVSDLDTPEKRAAAWAKLNKLEG